MTGTTDHQHIEQYQQQQGNEELWRTIFVDGHPDLTKQHRLHLKLPKEPRCRLCMVPFEGIGGWFMRRKGKAPNPRNPNYCTACDKFLEAFPGGADIDVSMLFVDIRESTQYADSHTSQDVSNRINAFLNRATSVITDNDGFILAFYGDCIVACWPPGFSGEDHAQKASQAGKALVADRCILDHENKPVDVGVGVNTGKAFIGTVNAMQGTFRDVSLFGTEVIRTARLASIAKPGQALCSGPLLAAINVDESQYTAQTVELKGLSESMEVFDLSNQ